MSLYLDAILAHPCHDVNDLYDTVVVPMHYPIGKGAVFVDRAPISIDTLRHALRDAPMCIAALIEAMPDKDRQPYFDAWKHEVCTMWPSEYLTLATAMAVRLQTTMLQPVSQTALTRLWDMVIDSQPAAVNDVSSQISLTWFPDEDRLARFDAMRARAGWCASHVHVPSFESLYPSLQQEIPDAYAVRLPRVTAFWIVRSQIHGLPADIQPNMRRAIAPQESRSLVAARGRVSGWAPDWAPATQQQSPAEDDAYAHLCIRLGFGTIRASYLAGITYATGDTSMARLADSVPLSVGIGDLSDLLEAPAPIMQGPGTRDRQDARRHCVLL